MIHNPSAHPSLKNQITVGCILCTSKTIKDIKFTKTNNKAFIDWLKECKIFIEVDSLGYEATRMVGYLLTLHLNITHHATLKETLVEHLH